MRNQESIAYLYTCLRHPSELQSQWQTQGVLSTPKSLEWPTYPGLTRTRSPSNFVRRYPAELERHLAPSSFFPGLDPMLCSQRHKDRPTLDNHHGPSPPI